MSHRVVDGLRGAVARSVGGGDGEGMTAVRGGVDRSVKIGVAYAAVDSRAALLVAARVRGENPLALGVGGAVLRRVDSDRRGRGVGRLHRVVDGLRRPVAGL